MGQWLCSGEARTYSVKAHQSPPKWAGLPIYISRQSAVKSQIRLHWTQRQKKPLHLRIAGVAWSCSAINLQLLSRLRSQFPQNISEDAGSYGFHSRSTSAGPVTNAAEMLLRDLRIKVDQSCFMVLAS